MAWRCEVHGVHLYAVIYAGGSLLCSVGQIDRHKLPLAVEVAVDVVVMSAGE